MGISQAEYLALLSRLSRPDSEEGGASGSVERESELHRQIKDYCRGRRWIAIHSRMDRPTTQAVGTPDFLILADGGRIFLVEAKAGKGKLSLAQRSFALACSILGHTVHTVRRLDDLRRITANSGHAGQGLHEGDCSRASLGGASSGGPV